MRLNNQVLYRKWRPRRFSELAGQEHVTTVLQRALQQQRVAHAYLFCGPRGTGKTTSARVLARAINCLTPQGSEPDNQCAMCRNIDQGQALDLIEMDAASNRGIDEIRSLREKVHFAPAEGKYKVYIVDEAHMLTEAASNAFLKTLEEPPPHAIFVLCTTEPHKILPTIISRCQRLDFRRISTTVMVERLQFICQAENIEADPKVLEILARSAEGSLRDAETLLEQMIVSYGQTLELQHVQQSLGMTHSQTAKDLANYLVMGNIPAALGTIGRASRDGSDIQQIHRQSIELVRGLMLVLSGAGDTIDLDMDTLKEIEELSTKTTMRTVMACLKALAESRIHSDSIPSLQLEMAVMETAFTIIPDVNNSDKNGGTELPVGINSSQNTISTMAQPNQRVPAEHKSPPHKMAMPTSKHAEEPALMSVETESPTNPDNITGDLVPPETWNQVVQQLRRQKGKRFFLGALLKDCKAPYIENGAMVLPFNYRSNKERMEEELQELSSRQVIESALEQFLGSSYELRLTLRDGGSSGGMSASATSPLVRSARAMGGRVIEEKRLDE
ncbi:DNA polymerase III subunit gamma/tau [SAR202 cluster bacterium AD-804-J14_MRT_500m]|nr:DNA polymerase III subunit gamma/tau [SAR202 cluster bacterium AD-804-J14_MRT_500m]